MGNHCMTSLKPLDIIRRAPKPTTSTSGQASDISSSIVTPSTDNTSYSSTISCSSAPSPSSSSFQTYIDESGNPSRSSSSHLISFSFNDLKLATRNFRPESFLGEGGFGSVYKGWIDQQMHTVSRPGAGMPIAVKRLNRESMQGHKEWLMELHVLSQLHHPNLVKLYGFCAEDEQRLLVYEFMPRGSLENHLFRRASISWELRMKIIMGAANALAFLHDSSVIYRDFKTSNILLDSEFNAKLSDFGLAKGGPTGLKTHTSTSVVGTNGYAAPEYVSTGHLSLRSDLYSFGVVLLEILTGRPVLDGNRPTLEQNLVSWSKPFLGDKKKLYRLTDPRLEGKYSLQGVTTIASLAWRCLQVDSKLRPQMGEIVRALEPLVTSKEAISSTRTRRSKYMKEAIATKPQCCQNGYKNSKI